MSTRTIAVWPHSSRPEAFAAGGAFASALAAHGLKAVGPREQLEQLRAAAPGVDIAAVEDAAEVELAVVFGGDGTILRAAEWALPREVPLLGVNMGHVGFLAELELSDTDRMLAQVVERRYDVEERLTLDVVAKDEHGATMWTSPAVNEVALEKSARERMLDALVRIDHLPYSRWSCDGILVSTPTGSTAYAFSAGGPVVWPDVEALLVVPLSAHALYAKPAVISPESVVEVRLLADASYAGVVWCDGRRTTAVRGGQTVVVVRGQHRLRIARLGAQPFTSRLVRKFGLNVEGWRNES